MFAVPINAEFYFNILEQNEALLTGFHPFWVGNIIQKSIFLCSRSLFFQLYFQSGCNWLTNQKSDIYLKCNS